VGQLVSSGFEVPLLEGWGKRGETGEIDETGLVDHTRCQYREVGMAKVHSLDDNRTGVVVSINLSGGGVPKKRVSDAKVSLLGLHGDAHNDKEHHGGPDRAVCLYAIERIHALQAEGHPIDVGTAGENVTVEGLDWDLVVPGTRMKLGAEVLLEIASFTSPCKTIRESFIDGRFVRISQKLPPGWSRVSARVLSEGQVHFRDSVELLVAPE
jgi:MOSC domain-containing protein YiiM